MNNLDKLADHPRARIRSGGLPDPEGRCVVFWMQRSQRGVDNPALDVAVEAANALAKPVVVFFAPVPFYPNANLRHYEFLAEGIPDIAATLEQRGVGFVLRRYPEHSLLKFCDEVRPALVVGDENPMRQPSHWREVAASKLRVPFWTVDSDVIVPSRLIEKEQYAAHIIRKKLHAQVDRYLVRPKNPRPNIAWKKPRGLQSLLPDFDILQGWELDRSVSPVRTFRGGTAEGMRLLRQFVKKKLSRYAAQRNHPEIDGTSQLSPYLHFGHISPITVALAVEDAKAQRSAKDDYLDELITWRELAINFAHFNKLYDSMESAPDWAHRTLAAHVKDARSAAYTRAQLESAATHDELWNAAQLQMLHAGWMHNYMRMYWAKKILEWSPSPQVAYQTAVYLNDKYFLDGRDPNGYAGIAWAIAGKFDRPWFERPVYGTIRYMSGDAARKKFDAERYIAQMQRLAGKTEEQGKLFG